MALNSLWVPYMQINLEKIKKLPPDVKKDFYKMYLKYTEKKQEAKVRGAILSFGKHKWPDFIQGTHHEIISKKFNDMAEGKIKRLIVNMPPRHTKSEFASSFVNTSDCPENGLVLLYILLVILLSY